MDTGAHSGAVTVSALQNPARALEQLNTPDTDTPTAKTLEQHIETPELETLEQTLPTDPNRTVAKEIAGAAVTPPADPGDASINKLNPTTDTADSGGHRPASQQSPATTYAPPQQQVQTEPPVQAEPPVQVEPPAQTQPPVQTPPPVQTDAARNHTLAYTALQNTPRFNIGSGAGTAPGIGDGGAIIPPRRRPDTDGILLAVYDGLWPGTTGLLDGKPYTHLKPLDSYPFPKEAHNYTEGAEWESVLPDGRRVINRIPFGNGTNTVDQYIQDANGNWIHSRIVDNGHGGYQRWTDTPNGSTYANSPDGDLAERWIFAPGTPTTGEPDHIYTIDQQRTDRDTLDGNIPTTPEGWEAFRSLNQAGVGAEINPPNMPPGYTGNQLEQDLAVLSWLPEGQAGTPQQALRDAAVTRVTAAATAGKGADLPNIVYDQLTTKYLTDINYTPAQLRADLDLINDPTLLPGFTGPVAPGALDAVDAAKTRLAQHAYT
ncbi:hypothetical protein ACFWPJ_32530, partial [Nocardia sp. NPDC058497]